MRVFLPILLIVVGCSQPARAEEPHTFWGKTVEQWIAVYRDKSSTEFQRRQAVYTLGGFGAEAKAAIPDLIEALRDEQLGGEAMNGLIQIGGPAVPALREILNGPDEALRGSAVQILGRIGPDAKAAVPSLIRAINRPDPKRIPNNIVRDAVEALGQIGPEAKAAVPTLNDLLDDAGGDDFDVVLALVRIGAPPVRKLLDAFLRNTDPDAAYRLSWLGTKGSEAVPALRAALSDKRPEVRIAAASAIAQIAPSAPESVPVLIEALKQPDNPELGAGPEAEALARLGPRAKAAMPKLIQLVMHGSNKSGFLEDLLKVLVQIDPEGTKCVPVLIEALKHEELEVVDAAANCLSLLGPRAKDAVPTLATTLTRDFQKEFYNDYDPQEHAAKALRRIGPQAKTAIPALIDALNFRYRIMGPGRDYYAARAAAEVLGSFGTDARAAIPTLIETIRSRENEHENWPLYRAAILALGQIGPEAKAAVPVLRDLMTEYGEKARYHPEVVIALYQLAPDGKTIAERWLEKTMNDRKDLAMSSELKSRAMILGAMGRTSFETDCLTRHYLRGIDWMPDSDDPSLENWIGFLEGWFENIGNLGSAGRLAFPRLNEIRKHHRNPWVRMWAEEALERIVKAPPAKADETPARK